LLRDVMEAPPLPPLLCAQKLTKWKYPPELEDRAFS